MMSGAESRATAHAESRAMAQRVAEAYARIAMGYVLSGLTPDQAQNIFEDTIGTTVAEFAAEHTESAEAAVALASEMADLFRRELAERIALMPTPGRA